MRFYRRIAAVSHMASSPLLPSWKRGCGLPSFLLATRRPYRSRRSLISVDIAYILLYHTADCLDGVHRGGADFARRYIADRGAIAAFQRRICFY